MTWELVGVIVISGLAIGGWIWITHVVFTEGAQIRRAKRDAELAALKLSGQDKNRHVDFHI